MLKLNVEDLQVASFAADAPRLSVAAAYDTQEAACWSPLCMDTMQYYCKQTQVAAAE
jgi:hypothetical protein